jgi:hypothetical protein
MKGRTYHLFTEAFDFLLQLSDLLLHFLIVKVWIAYAEEDKI